MTGYLFKRISDQGHELSVADGGNYLAFRVGDASDSVKSRSVMGPTAVNELHAALGRWMAERGITARAAVADPEPIYTALVRRLVAEEVARVLPLHQSPQAAVPVHCTWPNCGHPRDMHGQGFSTACSCGACSEFTTDPQVSVHEYATNTGAPLCVDPECTSVVSHLEHDPEPKAVGHPEAPAVNWSDKLFGRAEYPEGLKFDYCTGCGHSWGSHMTIYGDGYTCTAQLGKDRCRCDRRRGESAPEPNCTCPVGPRIRSYPHSHIAGCPRSTSGAS